MPFPLPFSSPRSLPLFLLFRSAFAFFLAAVLLFPQLGRAAGWPPELPVEVAEAFERAGIGAEAVGIHVQQLEQNTPLLAVNPAQAFNPASTMKLVTTLAALDLLGPAFSWKTQAFALGPVNGGVLQGDLAIKGSGDPKLVLENLWMFLRQLRARGIRDIRGDLLLDRSAFEGQTVDAAAFDGDPIKPYNAIPDALLVNYKSLTLRFMPDPARGRVTVNVEPPLAGLRVAAPALSNGSCGDWVQKLGAKLDEESIAFAGAYPASCGERQWHIHPYTLSQTRYLDMLFRQLWRELGGSFAGVVKNGPVPAGAVPLAQWESPSLPEVIRDINKYSNNVMARQLFLTIGSDYLQQPANTERSAKVIKSWLAGKGVDAPELVVENGSGLSRNERVSAATLGRLLVAAYRSSTMPEFMASMPLVGYDGTMRRRMKTLGVSGNAHIKSGSLKDVRSIAGFVFSASGKRYAVVCIVNHPDAVLAGEAQDALLQWVYEKG